jgi:ActR/RegA family two-component response regulator
VQNTDHRGRVSGCIINAGHPGKRRLRRGGTNLPADRAAVKAARTEACDAAVLDINLGGNQAFSAAEALIDRQIPFVFVTGYGSAVFPSEFRQ